MPWLPPLALALVLSALQLAHAHVGDSQSSEGIRPMPPPTLPPVRQSKLGAASSPGASLGQPQPASANR